ncbi:transglycosylase SLT domain-containing protein [Clostridium sp. Mt-5]|uniref:Transglycosylase SLT domain-containing protein n=1 Tax=Clostridium moutaii TaxID=3240932 RepID=A0ABV4BRP4_9CLOT
MVGNDSVGKISLDLELTSDLGKQIEQAAGKIGEQIKASLSNIGNLDFGGIANNIGKSIEKSVESSMRNVQKTVEASINKAVSAAFSGIKGIKIPVEFDSPKSFSMPKQSFTVSTAQPRAPPMPKMDNSTQIEFIKSQIENWAAQLDLFSGKADQARAKVKELEAQIAELSKPTGNEILDNFINPNTIKDLQIELDKAQTELNKFASQSDKVGFKLADLDTQFARLSSIAKGATEGINTASDGINKVASESTKASSSMKNLSSSARSTGDSFRNSYSGMGGFMSSMFQWGIIFPMVAGGITTVGTFLGKSLIVNAQFANSLNLIKSNLYTAFMPIYNAVLPALNSLMSALATATAYIASFVSQLFGTTYNASFGAAQAMQNQIGAYDQTQKAAKQAATSLGTVGSSAANSSDKIKKAAKEAKGSVAAFDEVNQLQLMKDPTEKTPKPGKPAGDGVVTPIIPMPNMTPIETATAAWAEKFKSILAGLWAPFKQAWSAEGENTINAAKYALNGLGALIEAIGKSFYTVWTNGTGEKILVNLLRILQDILRIIGDISITFASAWNSGNIGTQVVQHLANALNNVLYLLDQMLQSVRFVWAEEGPTFANMFMQSLNLMSASIENITEKMGWIWDHGGQHAFEGLLKLGLKVGELALFILNNFVMPFVNWFVNMISPAIAVVLDWVGKLADKLSTFIDYLKGDGANYTRAFLILFSGFEATKFIIGIANSTLSIIANTTAKIANTLATSTNNTANQAGLVSKAKEIGANIQLIALYIKDAIVKAGSTAATIAHTVANAAGTVAQLAHNAAVGAWNVVCAIATATTKALSVAMDFLTGPIGLVVLAITAAIAIGVLLYQNWDTIKAKAAEIWDVVKQTVEWAMNAIGQKIAEIWDAAKDKFNEFKDYLGNVFATDWSTRFGAFGKVLNDFLDTIKIVWNTIKGVFGGIIDFVAGVFTGNWSRAWKGITEIFGSIFGGIVDIAKKPINGVIALIDAAIKAINKIHVDIPDWIPDIGGKSFGVDIPTIPYLAQGGIIDKPTLSMVGDAGKEAVVPLENNTGGLKMMAQMLSQEIKPSINANNTTPTVSGGISVNSEEGTEYGKNLNTNFAKGITDSSNVVTSAVSTIVTGITTAINNLVKSCIQYGQNIDVNLGVGITNNMDSIMNPLTNLINKITSSIQAFIQSCIGLGQNIDTSIGGGVTQNSSSVLTPLNNLINSITVNIRNLIHSCIGYGEDIDTNLANGIANNKDTVINTLNTFVIIIMDKDLTSFATDSIKYGQNMDISMSKGISGNADTILSAVNNLTSKIGSTLKTFTESCVNYGTSIVDELGSGIQASEDNLDSIVKDLTDKVVTQFKEGFGIHSPSRVMYAIGNYLMQGLINGMSSQNVSDFITKWIGDITSSAGGAASGNVSNWLTAAMMITGTPMGYLPFLENIAMNESTGNPLAINLWDSNAKAGHPSKGLMQMIDSTFSAHALPGMDDIYNPIDNAVSAIRYMISQYGSIENVPGIRSQMNGGGYVGYATGTNSAKKGLGWTGELGPEMIDFSGGEAVLTAMESIKLMDRAVNAIGRIKSAVSSFKTNIATLKQPELTMMQGRETNNNQSTSNNEFTDNLTTAIVNAILTALKLNSNNSNTNNTRDLVIQIDGAPFARILKPYLDKENQRVGNKLIIRTT